MISLHGTLYASEECNCSCVFEILPTQHSQDNQGDHSHIWDDSEIPSFFDV